MEIKLVITLQNGESGAKHQIFVVFSFSLQNV